jgi:hypothetical protein
VAECLKLTIDSSSLGSLFPFVVPASVNLTGSSCSQAGYTPKLGAVNPLKIDSLTALTSVSLMVRISPHANPLRNPPGERDLYATPPLHQFPKTLLLNRTSRFAAFPGVRAIAVPGAPLEQ